MGPTMSQLKSSLSPQNVKANPMPNPAITAVYVARHDMPMTATYSAEGAETGARIGARIGGAIGGPEGAAIGSSIGRDIGTEVDNQSPRVRAYR